MTADFRQATRQWTLAQPVVSAFIGSIVRDVAARDDVLQETAVAVLESFDRYDPALPFLPCCLAKVCCHESSRGPLRYTYLTTALGFVT
ncbi:MAG: hypothetical protein ACKOFW_24920, partial [Planctomycetaceae bacterium]